MPLSLRRGRVTAIVERYEGLLRLEVDGERCVAYPAVTGPVEVDDEVLVNVQARRLELGSGGFDVLYANLTRGLELPAEDEAHVMKLPYSPLQWAARHVEEDAPPPERLNGLPVVCCSLHSQVAPVCAGLGEGLRVAYVQVAGGALAVPLSDTVRLLRARGLLAGTASAGPCFGGEVECVGVASALVWASAGFDAVVCAIGVGIVGTGTTLGHGGLAAADAANATVALGGRPVLAARVSSADERDRHRGVSHHTRAVLSLCREGVIVGWPSGLDAPGWVEPRVEVDASDWREACGDLPLSHMGRGREEEPSFFETAFAAGRLARELAG